MAAPVLLSGLELLLIAPAHVNGASWRETLALPGEGVAGAHGAAVFAAPDAPVGETLTLTWGALGRAALADVLAFLDRRAGRLNAFWCPSYRRDLTLLASTGLTWTVAEGGYADTFPLRAAMLPTGQDRLMTLDLNGTTYGTAQVSAAVRNVDGTATLSVLASGSYTLASAGSITMRLTPARLADDTVTVTYDNGGLARVDVTAVRLPRETP